MEELMLKIENITKQYKLGQIGGTMTIESEIGEGARIACCIAVPPTPTAEGV